MGERVNVEAFRPEMYYNLCSIAQISRAPGAKIEAIIQPMDLANILVELVALADNCAPAANAVAWRFAKELFEPGAPGLIANTMPLPQ